MQNDENGFWYPVVDKNECINCGLCKNMCPVYGKQAEGFDLPKVYAGWNEDDEMRKLSSSGGIFSEIAKFVIEKFNGVIYGAAWNEQCNVEHVRIDTVEELKFLRGSKYVQSLITENLYKSLEEDLNRGYVLFSGTSCQTAAVSKFADKIGKRDNLLTVGVLCHGVPTPKAWQEYLKEFCGDKRDLLVDINMRDKTDSWYWNYVALYFEDGTKSKESYRKGIWGNSFFKNLILRDSCYHCKFKEQIKQEDITLGDFWAALRRKELYRYNDGRDMGVSIILLNSEKGRKIFEELAEKFSLKSVKYSDVQRECFALKNSSSRHPHREVALNLLSKMPYSDIVRTFCPIDKK